MVGTVLCLFCFLIVKFVLDAIYYREMKFEIQCLTSSVMSRFENKHTELDAAFNHGYSEGKAHENSMTQRRKRDAETRRIVDDLKKLHAQEDDN